MKNFAAVTRISLAFYERRRSWQTFARSQHIAISIISLLVASSAPANVGGNNPTGPCGQLNGNVTTGCSYDPLTANGTRSITDITVAGAVGEYPLAFTRTSNTRYIVGQQSQFGGSGNWRHSYQWAVQPTVNAPGSSYPGTYIVDYPDGREVTFSNTNTGDVYLRGQKGVRDRLEQLNSSNPSVCKLHLPDGGQIQFNAAYNNADHKWHFTFSKIIDPYGQETTVSYGYDAQKGASYMQITEHAGRYLRLYYKHPASGEGNQNDTVLSQVVASDGRSIYYYYRPSTIGSTIYTMLRWVRPFSTTDNTYLATYAYEVNNANPTTDRPLLATCIDPMYDGPMWRILYAYKTTTNGDATAPVGGQLWLERNLTGATVSRLEVTANDSSGNYTRSETRGDTPTGTYPTRTFTYKSGAVGLLKSSTDFKGVSASQTYDTSGFLNSVTDRRGFLTTYTCSAQTGNVTSVAYPTPEDGPQTTLNYSYQCSCTWYDSNNRYWLSSDASGITYGRNGNRQIGSITYPDSANSNPSEQFSYDGTYGQVVNHFLRRRTQFNPPNFVWPGRFWEHWQYDNSRRVTAYWSNLYPSQGSGDPDNFTPVTAPTAAYQYNNAYGLVSDITENPGNPPRSGNLTTHFDYNVRGQLIRVTHPDSSYIQYGYNANGTLWWTADERHPSVDDNNLDYATVYTYDDYKRLRTVTTPKRSATDSLPRTTTYYYDHSGSGEDFTRTAALPTSVVSPGGKIVQTAYDENLRTLSVTAVGDTSVQDATTSYTYDANGNVLSVTEPNGQSTGAVTTYVYDKMNRVWHVIDPIPADRNSNGYTMSFGYDASSNVLVEKRADDQTCSYSYDSMGRVMSRTGYGGDISNYTYDEAGAKSSYCYQKSSSHNDCITHLYLYDGMDRLTAATYAPDAPPDSVARSDFYWYDAANFLVEYGNPATEQKLFTYDNRGRLTNTCYGDYVNGCYTGNPAVTISYDVASRPQTISTAAYIVNGVTVGATSLSFGYDEANNRTYEDQAVNGITRRVQTDPDADGNRWELLVKHGTNFGTTDLQTEFTYTSRNELRTISRDAWSLMFRYSYDASGNVIQRYGENLGDSTSMQYDALNRPIVCSHPATAGTDFVSHYDYDKLGNLRDTWREEELDAQNHPKGDVFGYDSLNQLTSAQYSASNPQPSATPTAPAKQVTYQLTWRNRTSMRVQDFIANTDNTTTYSACDLNQYTAISGLGMFPDQPDPGDPDGPPVDLPDQMLTYDNNFNVTGYNGWTYLYDFDSRLISATTSGHTAYFTYDAFGRCAMRKIDNVTRILTYDQWTPVAEWDGAGNLTALNVFGTGDDEILYRRDVTHSWDLYYKSDPFGNVRFILNGAGLGSEKYTYDAFGKPTIKTWGGQTLGSSAVGNVFMFSGRPYYTQLTFSDMRNRIYSPGLGRFYQADPLSYNADPVNLFRFCGSNPLLGGDPTGLHDPNDANGNENIDPSGGAEFTVDFSLGINAFVEQPWVQKAIFGGSDSDSTSWTYTEQSPIYVMGLGGSLDPIPVSPDFIARNHLGHPTGLKVPGLKLAESAVEHIIDAVYWVSNELGINQSDMDALAMMPAAAPVVKTGQVLEELPALVERLSTIGKGEGMALETTATRFGSLTSSEVQQIQAFVNRYNAEITVVGSRAAGTAGPLSDFDYLVAGNARLRHSAAYYLPRGAAGGAARASGLESGIDIFNGNKIPLDVTRRFIQFKPGQSPVAGPR
jgi:RHS repeat-associated protein